VREINDSNLPVDNTSRWAIRGSRLFNPDLRPSSLWKEEARSLAYALKRLPSRRWAITHHVIASRVFEDEDDDEDEYEEDNEHEPLTAFLSTQFFLKIGLQYHGVIMFRVMRTI